MPPYLKIDPQTSDHKKLRPAAEVLLDGGVVAGPTETFYGLMAAADHPETLERLMKLKGRDGNKPLLLLVDRPERLICYVREIPEPAERLMKRFWPGALTLLFRAPRNLHPSLVGPRETVGLRVEGLASIRMLVRSIDRAITGTSANPGGMPPARRPEEVEDYFGDSIDLIIDGGECPGGAPSTIIDVSLGPPRLIRDGGLSLNEMFKTAPDMRT